MPLAPLFILALLAITRTLSSTPQHLHQQPSLETLLIGKLTSSLWSRVQPVASNSLSQRLESILSLHSDVGMADVLFTYSRDSNSTSLPQQRIANTLVVRFYDTPYVNSLRAELKLPLFNYSQADKQWAGSSIAEITYFTETSKTTISRRVGFKIGRAQCVLELTPSETVVLVEDPNTQIKYFPIVYLALMCAVVSVIELSDEQAAAHTDPRLVSALSVRMLGRLAVLVTQSLKTPSPYGGILFMMAVMNIFLAARFIGYYATHLSAKRFTKSAVILAMLLLLAEITCLFNPCWDILIALMPILQIASNFSERGNANPQHVFIFAFLAHSIVSVYYNLADNNVFRVEPNHSVAYAIVIAICTQLVILQLQRHKSVLRKYFKRKSCSLRTVNVENKQCAICLDGISAQAYIVTQCNHVFHESCLRSWVRIKTLCPLDRRAIDRELLG